MQNKVHYSFRFMSSSLSNHVDNLSDSVPNTKCTDCKSYLEYKSTNNNQLIFNCQECSKNHKKHFNKELINKFAKTFEFYLIKKRSLSI